MPTSEGPTIQRTRSIHLVGAEAPHAMIGDMGLAEVSTVVPDKDDEVVVEYITQLRAFGAFYGCEPDFNPPDPDDPDGTISFSLDGNGGRLNDFTPFFIHGACNRSQATLTRATPYSKPWWKRSMSS